MRARVPEFIREYGRILRQPSSGALLVAAATMTACLFSFCYVLSTTAAVGQMIVPLVIPIFAAFLIGGLVAGAQRHPRRCLGLVPFGMLGLCVSLCVVTMMAAPSVVWIALVGFFFGLVSSALRRAYLESVAEDLRISGPQLLVHAGILLTLVIVLTVAELISRQRVSPSTVLWLMTASAVVCTVFAGWWWFREALEQFLEVILAPMYRIRGFGPGIDVCPCTGPLLIVANHSSWLDPLWLGKVIPRRLIPMMTSSFYDLPVLRWLMTRVVHAIRVQDSTYRREAPELQEAIAALDRGECVVIFPEGRLRRREEQPLRQFGQGVWHILSQRPAVPAMHCWIEGGWGSYMSFFGGPPLTNKRPDWWRPIRIGALEPQILTADLLADDRLTRTHCMEACLDARKFLGLKPFSVSEPLLADQPSGA